MRRERGSVDVGKENPTFNEEIQVQLILFLEWVELQEIPDDETTVSIVGRFMAK